MKITLKPYAKPVKQWPYRLNPKYKETVKEELEKMVAVGIMEPVDESEWVIPMVVQEKKTKGEIRICVNLRKPNDAFLHDPFPTSFTDEFFENVGGQEAYSFIDGFSGYHQIKGLMVDPIKIDVIINLDPPKNVKQLRATLGHIGYYKKFIKAYTQITMLIEKLLKKDATFCWDDECQKRLEILKDKMVIV
eukprot:PITA_12122